MAEQIVTQGQKISAALAQAKPGDAILLAGDFVEDVDMRAGGLTFKTKPGAPQATLKGRLVVHPTGNDSLFDNVLFDGRSSSGLPSPTVNAKRVSFKNSLITNEHTGIGFDVGSVQWGIAEDFLLDSCVVTRVGRLPATNHDHGVYLAALRRGRIVDTIIYDCADRGLQMYPDCQDLLVERSLIYGCGEGVLFGGAYGSESGEGAPTEYRRSNNNVIQQSILANSTVRTLAEGWWGKPPGAKGIGNVLSGNVLQGTVDLSEGGFSGTGNVFVLDMMFTDPAKGDFRLKPGSPAIGYGPASIQPTQDRAALIDAAIAELRQTTISGKAYFAGARTLGRWSKALELLAEAKKK